MQIPERLVSAIVEPVIGAPINVTNSNFAVGGSDNKSIAFTTSASVNHPKLIAWDWALQAWIS